MNEPDESFPPYRAGQGRSDEGSEPGNPAGVIPWLVVSFVSGLAIIGKILWTVWPT